MVQMLSDNRILARSLYYVTPADGSYNVIRIPRMAMVTRIILYIVQAYAGAGTPSFTVGFSGNKETADPDAFMTADDTFPRIAGYKGTVLATGVNSVAKWFNVGPGMITTTIDDGGCSTGIKYYIFAEYTVIS